MTQAKEGEGANPAPAPETKQEKEKKVTLATAFPADEFVVPGVATITRSGTTVLESDSKKVFDAAKQSGVTVQEVR